MIGKQPLIVPNKSFLALIGQRGGVDKLSLLDWANLTLEERVNYETIERYINGLTVPTGGGLLRYATVVVAASDSLHPGDADFVCTGTNDEVTINAALNAVAEITFRNNLVGKVLLMEGIYNTGNSIIFPSDPAKFNQSFTLEGMGLNVTQIYANGFYDVITTQTPANRFGSIEVREMYIQGGDHSNPSTSPPSPGLAHVRITDTIDAIVENCSFEVANFKETPNFQRMVILSNCDGSSIINNQAAGSCMGGIQVNDCFGAVVSGNVVTTLESGIELLGRNVLCLVANNVVDVASGIVVSATNHPFNPNSPTIITIIGNVMDGTPLQNTDNPGGISLIGAYGCTVVGNFADGGAFYIQLLDFYDATDASGTPCEANTVIGNTLADGDTATFDAAIQLIAASAAPTHGRLGVFSNVVADNVVGFGGGDGIKLSGTLCHSNNIEDNTVYQWGDNESSGNNYDGIHLVDGASYNNVQGNTCRYAPRSYTPGGAPPYPTGERYGINVDGATCAGNLVTNNDLAYSGATGSFNDTGTGTVTVAGNRL